MPHTKSTTVEQYLDTLPLDRREALSQVRKVILKHLPSLPRSHREGNCENPSRFISFHL